MVVISSKTLCRCWECGNVATFTACFQQALVEELGFGKSPTRSFVSYLWILSESPKMLDRDSLGPVWTSCLVSLMRTGSFPTAFVSCDLMTLKQWYSLFASLGM